jgi:hypothetical protein
MERLDSHAYYLSGFRPTEVGEYYPVIEWCLLLLASIQHAFNTREDDPPCQFSLLGAKANSLSVAKSRAVQTSIVESCLYAGVHGTQQAFVTGHTRSYYPNSFCHNQLLRQLFVRCLSRVFDKIRHGRVESDFLETRRRLLVDNSLGWHQCFQLDLPRGQAERWSVMLWVASRWIMKPPCIVT